MDGLGGERWILDIDAITQLKMVLLLQLCSYNDLKIQRNTAPY